MFPKGVWDKRWNQGVKTPSPNKILDNSSMSLANEILTVKEAAIYLRISETFLRRLVKQDKIPYFKVVGYIRFKKELLAEWVKQLHEFKNYVEPRMKKNRVIPDLIEP